MPAMPYLLVFLAGLGVDLIPVFAPPAWTLIVFVMMKWKLDALPAAAIGALGSTLGRYGLTLYMPYVSKKLLNRHKKSDLEFLGSRLDRKFIPAFLFTLGYCLTPLSSTALFTAAGVAKVNPLPILPAFFLGKFLSDWLVLKAAPKAYKAAVKMYHGDIEPKTIMAFAGGLLLLGALLFIDWKTLIQKKKLRFQWKFW